MSEVNATMSGSNTSTEVKMTISAYATESYVDEQCALKENLTNKVTSMPSSPTDDQYLSALAMQKYVESKIQDTTITIIID